MSEHDLETQQVPRRGSFGQAVDIWTPRVLKVLGCLGVGVSITLGAIGEFNPVMFGGSLAAASGGFTLDALQVLKSGKE